MCDENHVCVKWLTDTITNMLKCQFIDIWTNDLNDSSKFVCEKFFDILPVELRVLHTPWKISAYKPILLNY